MQVIDPSLDSDAGPYFSFAAHPNETINTIDAGFVKDTFVDLSIQTIKGVWLDSNRDGIKNDAESGVEGVTVTLSSAGADNIDYTSDDIIYGSTVTNANGDYLFSLNHVNEFIYVPYRLTFSNIGANRQFTVPETGHIPVFHGSLDVATDSDVIDSSGHTSATSFAGGGMVSAGLVDIIGTPLAVV